MTTSDAIPGLQLAVASHGGKPPPVKGCTGAMRISCAYAVFRQTSRTSHACHSWVKPPLKKQRAVGRPPPRDTAANCSAESPMPGCAQACGEQLLSNSDAIPALQLAIPVTAAHHHRWVWL